ILSSDLPLPAELAERANLPLLSHQMAADFVPLRAFMMQWAK
ncbi:hypothetical protein, partial [Escherichia coli]